ncbi:MAG: bifunctional metallophosphatase/5'-nucleotidase [Prevotella sp.]
MRPNILILSLLLLMPSIPAVSRQKTVRIDIIATTDVHGSFFPVNHITNRPMQGGMSRVAHYVDSLRAVNPDGVILLDNGDILQGQPLSYFYNFLQPERENLAASCLNFLRYDAITWGNHDIETGHAVYDKFLRETHCTALGANIIRRADGTPYLNPYTIIERKGVRVAVIGLMTSAIPNWLQEEKWSGMQFQNTLEAARHWVEYVRLNERPDIIVGLFHSGLEGGITTSEYVENDVMRIAREVSGFDMIFFGHDHRRHLSRVKNPEGRDVLLLNSASQAQYVSRATLNIQKKRRRIVSCDILGELADIRHIPTDTSYMDHFAPAINDVAAWARRKVGRTERTLSSADCFFGSSSFTDLLHNLQLKLTGADISIAAPLTFNTSLTKGDITISDLFKLYKFENTLYTMKMSGREVLGHLEMSYDLWTNTMRSPADHIMRLDSTSAFDNQRAGFAHPFFNFDSAAGIDYIVDVTKPDGQKVTILSMSDGTPFSLDRQYKVVMNSYRANGGGELVTQGAGIPKDSIDSRILSRSEHDFRYYLMQEIERLCVIDPRPNENWRFVPDDWAVPALRRDRDLLFPPETRRQ